MNDLNYTEINAKTIDSWIENGWEYGISIEEQIGGQLKAGFILKDLYEDYDSTGLLKNYIPTYIATMAIK